MGHLSRLFRRVSGLLRSEQIGHEIDEEMRFHIDMRAEDNLRAGMPPEEARREAERRFGHVTQLRERSRDERGGAWLESLAQDVRFGARMLVKNRGYSLAAVVSLALGIASCTAIFSVVEGVLLKPLAFPEPERIAQLREVSAKGSEMPVCEPNFDDVRAQASGLEAVACFNGGTVAVTGGSEPVRAGVCMVSADFFRVFGVPALAGRTLGAEDGSGSQSAVVSYGYWERLLGGTRDLSNAAVTVEGRRYQVVGVMPKGFSFPANVDVWIPSSIFPPNTSRTAHNWAVVCRVREGVTTEAAREEVSAIGRRLRSDLGEATDAVDFTLIPLQEFIVGRVRPALLILLGTVGFLMLIACANVANMLLAQTAAREKELAMREALGATRTRLARQFVTESLLLVTAAASLGTLLSVWAVDGLLALSRLYLPRTEEIGLDGTVLAFTCALSLALGVALGLVPALRGTRSGAAARDVGRGTTPDAASRRTRSALVVAQIALTLVLTAGAALLGRSFLSLTDVDPGFRPESAVAMTLTLPSDDTHENRRGVAFVEALSERLSALPGVRAAGGVSSLPLTGGGGGGTFKMDADPSRTGYADYRRATSGYFAAAGVPLLRGRLFEAGDVPDGQPVAVISQALAQKSWPGQDPIGQRVQFGNMDGDQRPITVVGVVGDVRENGLDSDVRPALYVNAVQRPLPSNFSFVVRADGDSAAIVAAMRAALRDVDPETPANFRTLEELFSMSLDSRRFTVVLFGIFAAVALVLAITGIYGVTSYTVATRTREIGVRMALGAGRGDVVALVLGRALRLAGVGIAAGLAGALVASKFLTSLLFAVSPTDPATLAGVSGLLLAVAVVACLIPARRATRVDPLVALRAE